MITTPLILEHANHEHQEHKEKNFFFSIFSRNSKQNGDNKLKESILFKDLQMSLASKNADRYLFIHHDDKENIYFYSVFSIKRFNKNLEKIKNNDLNIFRLTKIKTIGYQFFTEEKEKRAYKKFNRG